MSEKPTPVFRLQMFILSLTLFSGPVASLVIYTFINQFIRETGITQGDEHKTAGIIVRYSDIKMLFKSLEFRNMYFSLQNVLRSCSGATYQIDLGVDRSYFSVYLA